MDEERALLARYAAARAGHDALGGVVFVRATPDPLRWGFPTVSVQRTAMGLFAEAARAFDVSGLTDSLERMRETLGRLDRG